jgi:N-acetylmuramoyl-L-alanine amidase
MYIVAVDDGHGVNTAGKRTPDGFIENNFNHFTKCYLIEELKFNKFKICDTSPQRNDNSLNDRVTRANNGKADIFVSIHFNAMSDKWQNSTEGIETYYHNSSIKGKKLASLIHKELLLHTRTNNRGIKSDYVLYKTGLYVLKNTKMPAVLVECGFMDNRYDSELMKSKDYQIECSKEIAKGICNYFDLQYNDKDKKIPIGKNYIEILKEISKWSDIYIEDLKKIHKTGHNWKGLIEKLYYTIPK